MANMEDDEIDDWLDSDSDGAGEEQDAAPAPASSSSTTAAVAGDGTAPSEATTSERADPAPTTVAPSSLDHGAPLAKPASPPRVEPRPTAAVVAAEVTDANPAEAPPPLDDADHERAIPPPEPPAPSPVSTRVESESAPVDEMHTLSLSPGASPVALDVASARFDAPAVRLDATRFDLDSALEREEPEPEGPDAPPSSSPSTAPSPPLVASTAHAPPPVVSAMTAELTPPRADAIRSDAVSDPHLDLADSSAPAGLGALGGWALGGFGAATRLARDSLRAVASSDLADKTARAANGVRREIVNLSKHVAGTTSPVASSNPAGDEIATDVPEVNASRDSLWRAFGNLARESARALESAVESAATRPEASAGARVVSGFARRVEEGAFRLLRGAGDDSAAEDAAALERALVECGCASTLDELERLDADASRGSEPDAVSSRGFVAESVLELERLLNLEDPDADDGGDDEAGGSPCPGEDALELFVAMREEALAAANASRDDASSGFGVSSPSDANALDAALAPIRAEAATRVAEIVAASVAHLLDVAASLLDVAASDGPSPSSARWPPPTSPDFAATTVAKARARAVRRRVSAALNDAEAVVDAYAKARVAVADAAESAGAADAAASSRAREAAELCACAAKATARGYASDAAACLASIVAATAATAVAAKEGDVAATVAVQE